jgi:hypothetical protein
VLNALLGYNFSVKLFVQSAEVIDEMQEESFEFSLFGDVFWLSLVQI